MVPSKNAKKIIVAKSAGFCWGVKRAFDKVMEVAQKDEYRGNLYTYGPLIHNSEAVHMLEEEGVKVFGSIPEELEGAVFIRTHGISPDERARLKASGAAIFDATCPDVGIIQGIVKKHLKRGYHIIIVGNSKHPEVKALLGFAEGRGIALSSFEDIDMIPNEWENVCVVAQSTHKEESYKEITDELKKKFEDCKVFNTICRSTAHRQEQVQQISKQVDAMVVVGGYNSANTNKLAQISRETGTPTFHIETAEDLNSNEFKEFNVIGVTAGASTPRWSIEQVIEKFKEIGEIEVAEFSGKSELPRKTKRSP